MGKKSSRKPAREPSDDGWFLPYARVALQLSNEAPDLTTRSFSERAGELLEALGCTLVKAFHRGLLPIVPELIPYLAWLDGKKHPGGREYRIDWPRQYWAFALDMLELREIPHEKYASAAIQWASELASLNESDRGIGAAANVSLRPSPLRELLRARSKNELKSVEAFVSAKGLQRIIVLCELLDPIYRVRRAELAPGVQVNVTSVLAANRTSAPGAESRSSNSSARHFESECDTVSETECRARKLLADHPLSDELAKALHALIELPPGRGLSAHEIGTLVDRNEHWVYTDLRKVSPHYGVRYERRRGVGYLIDGPFVDIVTAALKLRKPVGENLGRTTSE